MDDFFAELDAEIAKATRLDQIRRDRDNARKRANTKSLPSTTRAAASAEFKELSEILAAHEWRSTATIGLFHEQTCDGCGSVHRIFLQYMEEQVQIRRPETRRWVRISKPLNEHLLPRSTIVQPMTTHICSDCCEDHGFFLADAPMLINGSGPLVPSLNYSQEDINAAA